MENENNANTPEGDIENIRKSLEEYKESTDGKLKESDEKASKLDETVSTLGKSLEEYKESTDGKLKETDEKASKLDETVSTLGKSLEEYKESTHNKLDDLESDIYCINEDIKKNDEKINKIEHKLIDISCKEKEKDASCQYKPSPDSTLIDCRIKTQIRSDLDVYGELLECRMDSKLNDILAKCKKACDGSLRETFENYKSLLDCKIKNKIKSEFSSYQDLMDCRLDNKFKDIIDKSKNSCDCSCGSSSDSHSDSCSNSDSINKVNEMLNKLGNRLSELEKNKNFIPVGVIQAFAYINVPDGWLWCNGDAISRKEYADLFKVIGTQFGTGDDKTTFNVPDLRGQFLRGYPGGELDPDRQFGSVQGDAIRDIQGSFGKNVYPAATLFDNSTGQGAFQPDEITTDFRNLQNLTVENSTPPGSNYPLGYKFKASNVVPTANENRPKNISLLFCIKAVNG